MDAHELMIKTNYYLIEGSELTRGQKIKIVRQLLAAKNDERTKNNFYRGVKYPGNSDNNGSGRMYPAYFIPPYNNGGKLQTIIPVSPKTQILSANAYELELIRLLVLFAPDDPEIIEIKNGTLARLRTTCFGNGCPAGECFHSSVPVLRFLAAAAPDDTVWIKKLISFFNAYIDEKLKAKKCGANLLRYYWLCLSELPVEITTPKIKKYENRIVSQLKRGHSMNNENDKTYRPAMICAIRNALARLPEYAHIKNRRPFVNPKDGRIYFNLDL